MTWLLFNPRRSMISIMRLSAQGSIQPEMMAGSSVPDVVGDGAAGGGEAKVDLVHVINAVR